MPDLDITQYTVTGALGRHMVLDERSLAYRRRYYGEPIKPVEWTPKVPVLNQQDLLTQGIRTSELVQGVEDVDALGSCTANSATCLISILRTTEDLAAAGLDVTDPVAAERWAIGLYSDATHRDQWHDNAWPSDDCGSSGLGVAKALRHRGLIDQYGHATTAEELCRDLQSGPVLMGMPWVDHFFTPDQDGFIDADPDWQSSPIAGGHEVCLTALESVSLNPDGTLADDTVLRFVNSWSDSWGDHGSGRLRLSTYRALRQQIDCTQPRLDSQR
ncbi:hypothetical protein [Streptomyces sp. NPDC048521]|uniref:hypothetical protein n=1 Tax=Streptomyces sp. NPDC048521 TaxID=3365566 RepID=UPI0037212F7B